MTNALVGWLSSNGGWWAAGLFAIADVLFAAWWLWRRSFSLGDVSQQQPVSGCLTESADLVECADYALTRVYVWPSPRVSAVASREAPARVAAASLAVTRIIDRRELLAALAENACR